ncbi:hypothetical protein RF11_04952 [Thelohanellus kitauei]|uniref:G-protein coupled receptors family 1 profile domain-containing protein n=1 Tax=Thelohanellus kitauei TaxID=669202 RepID=A0A0C2ID68_THEKT|nr:hypothetical protein RF11_04952 [Thelohanellus kitauei]
MVISFKIICYSFLWIVTGISIFLLITDKKFRNRVPNIIVTNLLISDSLSSLLSSLFREYFINCKVKPYTECTIIIVFTRTFGYISMAFLMFFTVERYIKLTYQPYEYMIFMSKTRLKIAISSIWIGFSVFSVVTTPYWIFLSIPSLRDSSVKVCVYSNSMEPLTCFITLFLSQFLSIIIMMVINVDLVIKIRKIVKESGIKLGVRKEQEKHNLKLVKSVELNIFILSFLLTLLNLGICAFTVVDLIDLRNDLSESDVHIPSVVFRIFALYATLYPCCEAFVCFFMNRDIMDRMRTLFPKTSHGNTASL